MIWCLSSVGDAEEAILTNDFAPVADRLAFNELIAEGETNAKEGDRPAASVDEK